MGDVVGTVEVLDVLDHAVAAFIVEVHVDIRHRDTLGVQEALEEEVVLDGVKVGDTQAVGYHAACGAASTGAYGYAVVLGPVDEVLDYEEVVRESHIGYGLELEVDAVAQGLVVVEGGTVALAGSFPGQMAEEGDGAAEFIPAVIPLFVVASAVDDLLVFIQILVDVRQEGRVDAEFREDVGAVDVVALYLLHYLAGVEDGFGVLGEEGEHLVFALQVLLLGVAEALGVADEGVGGEADEAVVRGAVVLADEVGVVRGDHLDSVLLAKFEDGLVDLHLVVVEVQGEAGDFGLVEHYLQIVILAEDALVPFDGLIYRVHISRKYSAGDFAGDAGGGTGEPFVIFLQHLVADAGFVVVHSLGVADGYYLHQVLVAGVVLGQKDEVVVFAVVVVLEVVVVVAGDVCLAAQDGLDVGVLLAGVEELLDSVHVAVVGDGQAGHLELVRACEELLDVGHAIKYGIFGMYVQGNETCHK